MAWLVDRIVALMAAKLGPQVGDRLTGQLAGEIERDLRETVLAEVRQQIETIATEWKSRSFVGAELYLPSEAVAGSYTGPYMAASNPLARDFLHLDHTDFCRIAGLPLMLHRQHWEWAFIYEQLRRSGVLQAGKRGFGFGVGKEVLPAMFARAGVEVTATDRPDDTHGWAGVGQYGGAKEALFYPHILDRQLFEERVNFEFCDMKAIPEGRQEYDFCWSCCAFEHLGDLRSGLDFVVDSVERMLKVGGVACHTTELNLSSDETTAETDRYVLYRRRDLIELSDRLSRRGHTVEPLRLESGGLLPDFLVDLPPYRGNPHLKLRIGEHVSTSVGLVIRRGP